MLRDPLVVHEMTERPAGFVPPNLSPVGLELSPTELGDGVYALMANQIPKDNNGLVVGRDAALVIDAGVTPSVGRHIQETAARLTNRPIRYLVNTTYHGDHTFGNAAFAPDVTVLSSRANRAAMTDLAAEKRARSESMYGAESALDEVTWWRTPDAVFDRFCEIDLGGRVVQLWHFGPGNGSGDTIVYVPDAGVAWTGNFIVPAGLPPMMLIGDLTSYQRTIQALRTTLAVDTFVPGHGFHGPAEPGISAMLVYMESLATAVAREKDAGKPVEALYETVPMRGIEPFPGAPQDFVDLLHGFHRLNILMTYRWLDGAALPTPA